MSFCGQVARAVILGAVMAALAACAATYRVHGYVPPEEALAGIQVGDTRESVADEVGRPASEGLLRDSAWYYVQSRWRHYTYNAPEEVSRQVVAISFGPDDTVSNVESFGLEDGRVVRLSQRVTDSTVAEGNFFARLFGNLGLSAAQFLN